MAGELLDRDDLTVYVVGGVPRSFKRKLQAFVEQEARGEGGVILLEEELSEWVLARLRGEKRQKWEETPASSALWRAFRALSAARYHLQNEPELEERVREIRAEIEALWDTVNPRGRDADAEAEPGEGEDEDED